MSTNIETPESRGPERFFVAAIDGKPTLFTLHWDHSVAVASTQPALVETIEEVIAELRELAA